MARTALACLTALVAAFALACSSPSQQVSSTTPSPAPTIDNFVGTWSAGTGAPSGQCSKLDYTFTKVDATSATVIFDVTCGGYSAQGNGSGSLQSSVLKWSLSGTLSGTSVPPSCTFQFVDNTATLQGSDAITVNYSGTICGVSVSGTQVLHRK